MNGRTQNGQKMPHKVSSFLKKPLKTPKAFHIRLGKWCPNMKLFAIPQCKCCINSAQGNHTGNFLIISHHYLSLISHFICCSSRRNSSSNFVAVFQTTMPISIDGCHLIRIKMYSRHDFQANFFQTNRGQRVKKSAAFNTFADERTKDVERRSHCDVS